MLFPQITKFRSYYHFITLTKTSLNWLSYAKELQANNTTIHPRTECTNSDMCYNNKTTM